VPQSRATGAPTLAAYSKGASYDSGNTDAIRATTDKEHRRRDQLARRHRTTEAGPMSRLVALVMAVTVAALLVQIARSDGPLVARWLSLVLAVVPIGVAAFSTVLRAVLLGSRRDPLDVQAAAARSICAQHLSCLGSIAALVVVQLVWMG
jgi:hypothetical protein